MKCYPFRPLFPSGPSDAPEIERKRDGMNSKRRASVQRWDEGKRKLSMGNSPSLIPAFGALIPLSVKDWMVIKWLLFHSPSFPSAVWILGVTARRWYEEKDNRERERLITHLSTKSRVVDTELCDGRVKENLQLYPFLSSLCIHHLLSFLFYLMVFLLTVKTENWGGNNDHKERNIWKIPTLKIKYNDNY